MTLSTAVDPSVIARVLGIETKYENFGPAGTAFLPQRIAVVAMGDDANTYSTTKRTVASSQEVGEVEGYGSPAHLILDQLLPVNGDGVAPIPIDLYPLENPAGGTASSGDITPTLGTITDAEYAVKINNYASAKFTVVTGDTVGSVVTKMVAAVNGVLKMPMIASDGTTKLDLDAKFKGTLSNELYIEIDGPTNAGVTWAITQPTGGLTNPTVDAALAQIGNVWETLIVNGLELSDSTALDTYQSIGDGRWGALVRKPFMVLTGTVEATAATAYAISDARPTDRVNVFCPEPGGNDLPFVIAARTCARSAKQANVNPPVDYGGLKLDTLTPGADGSQWNFSERDAAVKAGHSTIEVIDGVPEIADLVTCYHPSGEEPPAYRYVVDIQKLMTTIYNLDVRFGAAEWKSAPLIPDGEPTRNPAARSPKDFVTAAANIVRNLGLDAVLVRTAETIPLIQAEIDSSNPKRVNLYVPVYLSGNTNVKSITLAFAFNFGG